MTILHLLSTQYLCVKMPIGQWMFKLISALYTFLGASTYDIRTEGGEGHKYLKFADKQYIRFAYRGGQKIPKFRGRHIWKPLLSLVLFGCNSYFFAPERRKEGRKEGEKERRSGVANFQSLWRIFYRKVSRSAFSLPSYPLLSAICRMGKLEPLSFY